MKLLSSLTLVLPLAWSALASEFAINTKNAQRCSGMYDKASWGGSVDPYIDVKFMKKEGSDSQVSLLIYEYKDTQLIGVPIPDKPGDKFWKCDPFTIGQQYCNSTQIGQYLLVANATERAKNPISTIAVPLNDPKPLKYMVKNTGYYCIITELATGEGDYEAVAEFRNAYGELAAAQIPKLPFYGGMTLIYAVMGIFWGFLYAQNRHDILPVQNYITAIIAFLVIEMMITWGYYDFENVHGSTAGSKAFLVVVAILNAARNAFSFFLLLIVCMGYGVVKESLGRTMLFVRILAVVHFAFCVVYTVASMVIHPEEAGLLVLLIIMPLSITLTIFYVWTLNSLNLTIKDLVTRKQHVKAGMYKKLWLLILATIFIIFGFFFLNSFSFASVGNQDFAPSHWQTRWFILDGWLNIVYLADVAVIAYLWRPTPNNRRFAMSDEIAQDDDGFEINSLADSLGESDIEDNPTGKVNHTPPDSGHSSSGTAEGLNSSRAHDHRMQSPLPAPRPTRPSSLPKASLEAETIFAVGEDEDDDKWSDNEEGQHLVKKND